MASRNRPYEQFGTYILFKKLEADALGELWRAGRLVNSQLGPIVALRRLTGGNRPVFVESAAAARQLVPQLTGTSFAKHQEIDVAGGVPYVAFEYGGGRSLRHLIDKARGGNGAQPNPLPLDQALIIAEKVALSLATTGELRLNDKRLVHGALVPQFIWISDDGEIRVAGQQLGRGFIASMPDPKFATELGKYFSPEYRGSGEPSKTSEVFAMGAILYLLVTGNEPPDAMTASAFASAIRAAKTMAGQPIPDDIRVLLDKSLNLDVNARYATAADMKAAISALAHGGKYTATTFNLAFYLSTLLKKEMEGEALEREKESKVNIAPYLEAPVSNVTAPIPIIAAPDFGVSEEPRRKSRMPLAFAAIGVAVAAGAGFWLTLGKKPAQTAPAPAHVAASAPAQKAQLIPTAVVAATTTSTTTAATATGTASLDPAAQKKAFEAAVEQKLQQEMMKLQADYTKNLQKSQAKNAPVQTASLALPPVSAPAVQHSATPEANAPSASALDERRAAAREVVPAPQPAAPQPLAPAPQVQQPAAAPQAASLRDGDVVDFNDLDSPVNPLSAMRVSYPPMALRSKIETTVIVTALIDEGGNVVDVKVLKGDPRFGFNDAAMRAVRGTRFNTPTKDGHRVKTWRPQTIVFKM
jgi:TonB family protein